ncbi:MAG: methyltransferase domain-containing protein [Chloroflexota bacterium]|nr:methyltransferase domain-containing protein [Chloroflexota bacterium]
MRIPSPRSFVAARLRERLVRDLQNRGSVVSRQVAAAMARVPRHVFVPEISIRAAYEDRVVLTRERDGETLSTLSQPSAVGRMLEDLQVRPGMRVLEIGAGTGYNAALLAELVGDPNLVTTVDIDGVLVERARRSLAAAGYPGVEVVRADGLTYEPDRPVDRIELSVEAPFIVPEWFRGLRDGGLILLPLRLRGIRYFTPAMRKHGDHLRAESDSGCAFMSMRGPATQAGPALRVTGIEEAEFGWEGRGEFPAAGLGEAFAGGSQARPEATVPHPGLAYVALANDNVFTVTPRGRTDAREIGFYDPTSGSACLIGGSAHAEKLGVRSVGGDGAFASFVSRLREWDRLGRPSPGDREMLAYPHDRTPSPNPGWQVIHRPHFNFLIGPGRVSAGG